MNNEVEELNRRIDDLKRGHVRFKIIWGVVIVSFSLGCIFDWVIL